MVAVILRVEKIFKKIPIYHVGLTYKCGPLTIKNIDFHPRTRGKNVVGERKQIHIGNSNKSIFDILIFEHAMNKDYFLLFNDCRHYSQELLDFSIEEKYDVVNMFYLHRLFTR